MTKSIVLIDTEILHRLNQAIGCNSIFTNSDEIFDLKLDGSWERRSLTQNPCAEIPLEKDDLVDVFMKIADRTRTNYFGPRSVTPACICPTECDCAAPERGMKSMSCPIHNYQPDPDPECPQHQI
jgi:hypothetical protein